MNYWGCCDADKRRNARLPGSNYCGADWKQVEVAYHTKSAGPWRFNELKKDLEGISQKVLTDSLRSMEADGIITRTVYPEVPPRVEYALTELGKSLKPILDSMRAWGEAYKTKH